MTSPLRFPGEDGGRSLSEMAQRDLDAALQLLADRAQYITGANGAAIALRRGGGGDLLCRASIGPNAPELGALLSTEFGLSGESVRTRRTLRCDDAERDARVNREVCRQLGIASVVVMPVVHDDEVLGVFELFSGRANAFGARDVSALERLSEMVDTAVRLARAAEELPERLKNVNVPRVETPQAEVPRQVLREESALENAAPFSVEKEGREDSVLAGAAEAKAPKEVIEPRVAAAVTEQVVSPSHKPPKRALLWSAESHSGVEVEKPEAADRSHVPPVLRGLRKCEACGFPVSAGRRLCVECEEKKWRGQLRVSPAASRQVTDLTAQACSAERHASAGRGSGVQNSAMSGLADASPALPLEGRTFAAAAQSSVTFRGARPQPSRAISATKAPRPTSPMDVNEPKGVTNTGKSAASALESPPQELAPAPKPQAAPSQPSTFVLSAGLEPSQSWFSANKYILGALLVVAAVVTAIFLLR